MNVKVIALSLLSFVFQLLLPVVIMGAAMQPLLLEPGFYITAMEKNSAYSSLYAMLPAEYSLMVNEAMLKGEINKLITSSINFLNGRESTFSYVLPVEEMAGNVVDRIPDCTGRETIDLTKTLPSCLPPSLDRNAMKQQTLKSLPSGDEALKPFAASLAETRKSVAAFNGIFFILVAVFAAVTALIVILNVKSPEGMAKWLGYNLLVGGILIGISAYLMPGFAAATLSKMSVPAVISNVMVSVIGGLSESLLIYSAIAAVLGAVIKFVLPLLLKPKQV